jgi:hypothetical protein
LPDAEVNSGAVPDAGDHTRGIDDRQFGDTPKRCEYVSAVATSVACYEDCSITLADGKRRGSVGMARAPTHCCIARPRATEAGNESA